MKKSPIFKFVSGEERRRWKFSESLGADASLALRLCQRIPLGSVNDWKGSSFSQVQQLTDVQDSTRDRSRRPVKTGPGASINFGMMSF